MSILLVLAVRILAGVAARNLSALARVQLACLPASGSSTSSSFRRQVSAGEMRKSSSAISEEEVLRVAPYYRKKKKIEEEEEEEEEEECVVCLSGIEEGDEIRELKCRHLFHRTCLDRWLARPAVVATCPLCRCRLLLTPQPQQEEDEEHWYGAGDDEEDEEEEDEEGNSDMMLFMACVYGGRSSWFWPSS
ncbi:hypothetical protein QOZ80_7AG0582460 [Eleusine coracana subsp. coracana]|nr:hypothetical protein QOZ80_7AG0582460 [Eleusine coracana subsp. coracana]